MSVTAVPIQPVKSSYIWWIWIGVVVAIAAAFLLARQGDDFWTKSLRDSDIQTTASGVKYKVLTPGSGPHPTDTDIALIGYEGRLPSGVVFDKNPQVPNPVNQFVPGFTEALKLMSKGEKMRIWIPSKLGYGAEAKGPIPANSNLIFEVTLTDFISQEDYQKMMIQRQMMSGGGGGGGGGLPPGVGGAPEGAAPDGSGGAPGGDTEVPAPKGSK